MNNKFVSVSKIARRNIITSFIRYRPNEEIEQQIEKWSEENDGDIRVKHNAMVIVDNICSSLIYKYISYLILNVYSFCILSFSAK